ncbi:hypothetical protein HA397_25975, partial [Escherichia coli]|nr:hypothetical protein [Escherichia coli]
MGLCLPSGRCDPHGGRQPMSDAQPRALAAYGAVTAAYWAFMLSDGALRMLVLLHFHTLGFSALQLAWLFLLYEFMGMVTNLSAGWLAARFGLTSTLYAGLGIQIVALAALAQLDPAWGLGASVAYVMAVQGASGVAKDLAKMSAKSAVKLLVPKGDGAPVKLSKFVEKPDSNTAAKMLAAGNYLWNAGIFLFRAADIISAFEKHAPGLMAPVTAAVDEAKTDLGFLRLAPEPWARAEDISIDYTVMERADNLSVVPFSGAWS